MPELPEVETVARQLAPLVVGRVARGLSVFDPKLVAAERPDLEGRTVRAVFRRGKRILLEFDPSGKNVVPSWLAVHLRMSGRLLWIPDGDDHARLPHERATLHLHGGTVRLVDPRRFGTLTWLSARDEGAVEGLDPMTDDFTPERLSALLAGSRQELKTWLLRQDKLVGLGNIYASEILWRARLSPFRAAGRVDAAGVVRLHEATRTILERAIERCGTTFSDFQDAHGVTGGFQTFLEVYDREGQPCSRCGAAVRRVVQGQRSTYYCGPCVRGRGPAARSSSPSEPRPKPQKK